MDTELVQFTLPDGSSLLVEVDDQDHVTLATTIVGLLYPYLGELCPKPDTRIGNAAIDAGDLGDWDL